MNLSSKPSQKAEQTQAFAGPKATKTIRLKPDELKEANRLLALSTQERDSKEAATLMKWTAKFEDGFEADVKIVNGDSGPWSETVLFDAKGNEVGCTEVGEAILGESLFEVDGRVYEVLVEADEAQTVSGPKLTATLRLSPGDVQEAQRLLALEGGDSISDEGAILMRWTAPFEDGCQAAVRIVNRFQSAPMREADLLDSKGGLLAPADDAEGLFGVVQFGIVNGQSYDLTIEAEGATLDTTKATGLRGEVASQSQVPTAADLAKADILAWLEKRGVKASMLDAGGACRINSDYRDEDAIKGDLRAKVAYMVDQLGARSTRKDLKGILLGHHLDPSCTPAEAKARVKVVLEALALPFEKLTAKTTSFSSLGYGSGLFVKIHGWKPNPALGVVEEALKGSGIIVQADTGVS